MKKREDVELLAPAGNFEALVAAVQNGANAIYLGGQRFGARAFAHNFDYDALKMAVQYCHLRNVKLYVTVNTLYSQQEIDEIISYLEYLYQIGIDALIIQDMGLYSLIKKYFPEIEIHMSTQASVRNIEGVRYFANQNVDRVVLAREMNISEIKEICQNCLIDIEVFVHGALCMSYSGQCLMSSMIAKRSGNKGECGQPCRLPYSLLEDGKNIENQKYLLSPMDLCTIEKVPELIEAGIKSFKIEGRMKRPEYVGEVVKAYRQAIDSYFDKKMYTPDILRMKKVFNRGFTQGFLFQDYLNLAKDIPGNQGVKIGKIVNYSKKRKMLDIQLSDTLYQNDRIYFPKNDFTRTITKLYKNNKLVNTAYQGDFISIEMDQLLEFQDVYKIVDSKIVEDNNKYVKDEHVKLPIQMKVFGLINRPLQLTIIFKNKKVIVKSNQNIEKAKKVPLTNERIKEQLSKLGNTTFYLEKCSIRFPDDGTISIKEINTLRRQAIDNLQKEILDVSSRKINKIEKFNNSYKERNHHKKIAIQISDISQLEDVRLDDIDQVFVPFYQYQAQNDKYIPYVPFLYDEKDFNEFLNSHYYQSCHSIQVNDFGALNLVCDKNVILGYHMNIANNQAAQEFNLPFIVSYEMSKNEIQTFKVDKDIYFTAYSQIINMNLKHCIISDHYFSKKQKGCQLCKKHQYCLKDRKQMNFKVITDHYCNNYILHTHRFYFDKINELNIDYVLLNFLDEKTDEIQIIIDDYLNIINHQLSKNKKNYSVFQGYFTK